ncbi:glycosyltransferase [Acetobacteraceae bacterium H6797]|nr:glycosyltransferase [Acetobacteraceae bacterium H6797]
MRAARERGHEALGLCAEGEALQAVRDEGFAVTPIPFADSANPLFQGRTLRALQAAMTGAGADMVHAHGPLGGLLGRFAARRAGVRRIAYTAHGFDFETAPLLRRKIGLMMERRAGRITDRFLCLTEADAATARREGLHPSPIATGLGRDPGLYRPDPAARARLRAALGTAEETVVVLMAGHLGRAGGLPELLRAMEQVPGAELWLAGEAPPGPEEPAVALGFAQATRSLGPRLKRLGYRGDMPALMAAADLLARPSLGAEPGLPVIEAMLSGLPVVASEVPGPRDQVIDGVTGYLTPARVAEPLAGALGVLARDAALRVRMGEAGRARAMRDFDEAKVIRRTMGLLGL